MILREKILFSSQGYTAGSPREADDKNLACIIDPTALKNDYEMMRETILFSPFDQG